MPAMPALAAEEEDTLPFAREDTDNPLVEIRTTHGSIVLELFPQEAPMAVANFIGLAEGEKPWVDPETGETVTRPFYDGLTFHRVIDGFMIQGGSPTGLPDGTPGFVFDDEINARSLGLDRMALIDDQGVPHPFLGIQDQRDFRDKVLEPLYREMGIDTRQGLEARIDEVDRRIRDMTVMEAYQNQGYNYTQSVISRLPVRGVIAMANSGPDSNGSQFFITLVETDWLAGRHTVFGRVRSGMDIVDTIGSVRVDADSRPLRAVRILGVSRIDEAAGEADAAGANSTVNSPAQ